VTSTLTSFLLAAGLLSACAPVSDSSSEPPALSGPSPSPSEPCDFWGEGSNEWLMSCAITPESISDFDRFEFKGFEEKQTFDRRVNDWVTNTSIVYTATYQCTPDPVDVVVNSEFTEEQAEEHALRFAQILGQMPIASRAQVREIWIHGGDEPAGGGNNSVLFHTEYADQMSQWVEEVFLHEAAHTSLDYAFGGSVDQALWSEAAEKDGQFISQYAADYPEREDIAESHVAYVIRELSKGNPRLEVAATRIGETIPARLEYFEKLGKDFAPLAARCE
jgi:hypothetical protein